VARRVTCAVTCVRRPRFRCVTLHGGGGGDRRPAAKRSIAAMVVRRSDASVRGADAAVRLADSLVRLTDFRRAACATPQSARRTYGVITLSTSGAGRPVIHNRFAANHGIRKAMVNRPIDV